MGKLVVYMKGLCRHLHTFIKKVVQGYKPILCSLISVCLTLFYIYTPLIHIFTPHTVEIEFI